jgi:hypothetical protein
MRKEMRNKKAPNDTNTTFVKFQTYADSCVVLPLHIPQQAVMTNLEQSGQRLACDRQVRVNEKMTTTNNSIIKQAILYSCRGPL